VRRRAREAAQHAAERTLISVSTFGKSEHAHQLTMRMSANRLKIYASSELSRRGIRELH
jgi:hypothetical protein